MVQTTKTTCRTRSKQKAVVKATSTTHSAPPPALSPYTTSNKLKSGTQLRKGRRNTKEKRQEREDLRLLDGGYDPDEDRIAARELHRPEVSAGDAPPLWSLMPEFRGFTHAATVPYNLRNRAGFAVPAADKE
ncbi:MAG: hypothetical protein M1840_001717 [Geoglossum simile]|nr:MAG: hypothetical protein M1840_001717 [Geoglossum simile]